jgi:hypothetical protein
MKLAHTPITTAKIVILTNRSLALAPRRSVSFLCRSGFDAWGVPLGFLLLSIFVNYIQPLVTFTEGFVSASTYGGARDRIFYGQCSLLIAESSASVSLASFRRIGQRNHPQPCEHSNERIRRIKFKHAHCKIRPAREFVMVVLKKLSECDKVKRDRVS